MSYDNLPLRHRALTATIEDFLQFQPESFTGRDIAQIKNALEAEHIDSLEEFINHAEQVLKTHLPSDPFQRSNIQWSLPDTSTRLTNAYNTAIRKREEQMMENVAILCGIASSDTHLQYDEEAVISSFRAMQKFIIGRMDWVLLTKLKLRLVDRVTEMMVQAMTLQVMAELVSNPLDEID